MAANSQALVKSWIQYLKNSQIVGMKSDPATGKLQYKREITTDDVSKFLETKTDFTPEQISNAIHIVLANKVQNGSPKLQNNPVEQEPQKPGTDLSTWMHSEMRPGKQNDRIGTEPSKLSPPEQSDNQPAVGNTQRTKIAHDPDSISDIDYREIPNQPAQTPRLNGPAKSKPRFKLRSKPVREDFEDNGGYTLDEKDIEQIFNILLGGNEQSTVSKPAPENNPAVNKTETLNTIKRVIRDTMTDEQRKAFWRSLNEI